MFVGNYRIVDYEYNAWGNILNESGTGTIQSMNLQSYNHLKYRGYFHDTETGFYYLENRYYDPVLGRFISPDNLSHLGESGDIVSYNLYTYCGNNPISRRDAGGNAWETVFDIISLGSSIVDVAVSPADPWAWVALIGDVADVAIPFVAGIGEGARALKAAANATELSEDVVDLKKITNNTLAVIEKAAEGLNKGTNTVYISRIDGVIEYVGITNDFGRRRTEWEGIRNIEEFVTGLDRQSARYVEQAVISTFGRKRNGGLLSNMINSVAKKKLYNSTYEFFYQNLYL